MVYNMDETLGMVIEVVYDGVICRDCLEYILPTDLPQLREQIDEYREGVEFDAKSLKDWEFLITLVEKYSKKDYDSIPAIIEKYSLQ